MRAALVLLAVDDDILPGIVFGSRVGELLLLVGATRVVPPPSFAFVVRPEARAAACTPS